MLRTFCRVEGTANKESPEKIKDDERNFFKYHCQLDTIEGSKVVPIGCFSLYLMNLIGLYKVEQLLLLLNQ